VKYIVSAYRSRAHTSLWFNDDANLFTYHYKQNKMFILVVSVHFCEDSISLHFNSKSLAFDCLALWCSEAHSVKHHALHWLRPRTGVTSPVQSWLFKCTSPVYHGVFSMHHATLVDFNNCLNNKTCEHACVLGLCSHAVVLFNWFEVKF